MTALTHFTRHQERGHCSLFGVAVVNKQFA